jgi:acetylglutamate kinase
MKRRLLMKIGGKAFDDRKGFIELAGAIKENNAVDFIIVHGGGAEISQALQVAGRPTHFVDGVRVTQAEDVAIVEKVLAGVNARIAGYLEEGGVPCRQISGKTESLLLVEPLKRGGLDFGFVGEIKKVNPAPIMSSLANQQVPVVSPVSIGEDGGTYNVNADSAAAALAIASECTDLLYFTDVTGVQIDSELRPLLSLEEARQFIAVGKIKGGMIAKLESAFEALSGKVPRVHILKWQGPETLRALVDERPFERTTLHS